LLDAKRYALPALLLLLPIVSGCTKIDQRRQADALELTLRSYESVVRWGPLVNAYGFLRPEEAAKAEIPPDLDQVRIVSYVVRVAPAKLDEDTASQTVEIGYTRQDQQTVRTISDRQIWVYDRDKRIWHLGSEVPRFH
jgi:hypothetical protein